tara:strand:- start:1258 stop:1791 length:534 start_codon:yes stop_codon:yes gene_type:complete
MKYLLILFLLILISCSKPKSVLICGDHECINKAEAKQYFNDNLSIEVRIISKDREDRFDLVSLNLKNDENKEIAVVKNKKENEIKKLSKEEIKIKKKELKEKIKIASIPKKNIKTSEKKLSKTKKKNESKDITKKKVLYDNSYDICRKLDKCDIDSITNYLIKISKKKDFPDITVKN